MIVIDASVAVKWVIPEPGSDWAQAILDRDDELIAPELVDIEVRSAFVRKYNAKEIDLADVQASLAQWSRIVDADRLGLQPHGPLIGGAVQLSLDHAHRVPDGLYLELARQRAAGIATADQKMASIASTMAIGVVSR